MNAPMASADPHRPASSQLNDSRVIIRCEQVAHTYGSGATAVVAVHGVSCEIARRTRLAITGPSGSGKSTLLHLMAGLETPTSGRLTWPAVGGHPTGRPGLVGVVFQGPSLIPALSVLENVALPLVLDGVPDREARRIADEALLELEINALGSKLPEELSGGQSQRVAIARVLAARPAVILADEPTGQLDRVTGAHVIEVLLRAADALGAAVVVSTHDPLVAERLDRRWRMRDGVLTTDESAGSSATTSAGATS